MELDEIGSRIYEARKKLGFTQRDLAIKLNVSDKTVSKWERGAGCPDISLLVPISEALQMSVDELITGSISENKDEPSRAMLNLMHYSKKKMQENKERIFRMLYLIMSALLGIGFAICLIVDYVMNSSFTWSIVTSASILYAWCLLTAVLKTKKRFRNLILTACILVYPLLYAISYVFFSNAWFLRYAVPIATTTIIYVFAVAFIWMKTSLLYWYKLAVIFLLAPIPTFVSNYVTDGYLYVYLINFISCMIGAVVFTVLGFRSQRRIY